MHARKSTANPLDIEKIGRRAFVSAFGGLILTAAGPGLVRAQDDESSVRAFGEFLALANPAAQTLVGDTSAAGQDRYLRSVAALAAELNGAPMPGRWNFSEQGDTPDSYAIGFMPGGEPFRVLHWRLAPGASCRAHAHTYGNVVTVGLEGVARVRNYEVVGGADYADTGTFRVRQTVDQLLRPGSVNLVSLHRNYIHEITAGPDGARGLDITTPLAPRPDHGTPYLSLGSSPVDAALRLYEASWEFGA